MKDDKTVLVTGASKGIGKATCEALLKLGYTVAGIARSFSQEMKELKGLRCIEMDLSEIDSLEKKLKAIAKELPPLYGIVNNVGKGLFAHLEELSVQQMRNLMDLNFLSHCIVTKTFLAKMKAGGKEGKILFVGSEAALAGKRQGSLYCASKFALRGFAQALRHELASNNIAVSIVHPGMVKTQFFNPLHFEPGEDRKQHLAPEDVAQMLVQLMECAPSFVVEELSLSPLQHVVKKKK